MTELEEAIAGVHRAHQRLLGALHGLTDEQARRPSRLPGWTVGHVLTHLARNADSVTHRLHGAARGEVVDQYPGGAAQRSDDIEAGADRSAGDLLADVATSAADAEKAIAAMPSTAWANATRSFGGGEVPGRDVVFSRWREVEVHHSDLDLGYEPADWDPALVARWLPRVLAGLTTRADAHALLAWGLDRAAAPPLEPWG